ncbi:hypothetical protein LINPERHAP1_LOCUS35361 [Linum perenne]
MWKGLRRLERMLSIFISRRRP